MAGEIQLPPSKDRAEWEREVERRLGELEGARTLGNTTLQFGQLTIADDDGNVIGILGDVLITDALGAESWEAGILLRTPAGENIFLATGTRGLIKPIFQTEWRAPGALTAANGAAFASVWQAIVLGAVGDAVRLTLTLSAGAGTTGECRLRLARDGAADQFSDVITIPASTTLPYTFNWDLSAVGSTGIGDAYTLEVQGRRAAGASNVWVYQPLPLRVADAGILGATPGGR